MSDPTETVLIGGFTAALVIFVCSAWLRLRMFRQNPGVNFPGDSGMDGDLPDAPPVLVEPLPPALPVGKVPVWFFGRLDLAGAGLVFGVFFGLVWLSVTAPGDSVADLNPSALVMNIGFQFVMAGVVASLVVWRVGWCEWLGLRWAGWRWVFLIAPGAVFFMWSVFGGLQMAGYVKWMESLGVETVQDTVQLLQKSEDPLVLGLMALAAVIAAPLCEEIVFRGYFYPVLKKYSGMWPAAVCSALVFASAHGNLTAMLPLFIFGGLLVFLYEKTGSIWAPIAVHFCFNGATVLVQMVARYYHIPFEAAP